MKLGLLLVLIGRADVSSDDLEASTEEKDEGVNDERQPEDV